MKIAMTIQPQEILPQSSGGVDWGRSRQVLVRKGSKVFFVVPGHTAWSGVGSRSYYETSFCIVDYGARGHTILGETLHDGRMNKAVLRALTPKLEEFFGTTGFVDLISRKTTLVLNPK